MVEVLPYSVRMLLEVQLNIITKEPTANSLTIENTSTVIGMKSPDINTSLNASVVSDDNRSGAMIFGSTRQRSPFDANDDGFQKLPNLKYKISGLKDFIKQVITAN